MGKGQTKVKPRSFDMSRTPPTFDSYLGIPYDYVCPMTTYAVLYEYEVSGLTSNETKIVLF